MVGVRDQTNVDVKLDSEVCVVEHFFFFHSSKLFLFFQVKIAQIVWPIQVVNTENVQTTSRGHANVSQTGAASPVRNS